MDFARQYFSSLHDALPEPLLDVVRSIYQHGVLLTRRMHYGICDLTATDIFGALNLQTILPPLISLLTIYFAIISLYRTTTFFVRSSIFLVKWGTLIAAVAAGLGYITNMSGMVDWNPRSSRSGRRPAHTRPRPWDTFQRHQQWRAQQQEDPYAADAGRVAREMVEKIIDATHEVVRQGGRWGTLAGMALKTVTRDDSAASTEQKRRLEGKGKGKIR